MRAWTGLTSSWSSLDWSYELMVLTGLVFSLRKTPGH